MSARATITFSQPGVQPPVFVVTSVSTPPWQVLEMAVSDKKTDSGDAIFYRDFEGVTEGTYQYKIRVGEGHWVVDESKETATDEVGNRNNVVRAQPIIKQVDTPISDAAAEAEHQGAERGAPAEPGANMQHQEKKERDGPETSEERQDSMQLPVVPLPFIVVDKINDRGQPGYGDVESETLPVDTSKRTADADPDYESVRPESPAETKQELESSPVPVLVIEKSDDRPAFGDDFGENATSAQKLAHEMRTADAEPDKVIVKGEAHVEPGAEEERAAPLFRHESFESGDAKIGSQPQSPMDAIEEESVQSSTDQTSSEAGIMTPSDPSETKDQDNDSIVSPVCYSTTKSEDKLSNGPLLSHETGLATAAAKDELDDGPLLFHETGFSTKSKDLSEDLGELGNAPLMSHETGFSTESKDPSANVSELDNAPLMAHETGFSADETTKSKGLSESLSELDSIPSTSSKVDVTTESDNLNELNKAPLMSHETAISTKNDDAGEHVSELDHAPLMPHEVGLSAKSKLSNDDVSELDLALSRGHDTGFSPSGSNPVTEHSRATRLLNEDDDIPDDEYGGLDDMPLLPHERPSAMNEHSGSDVAGENGYSASAYQAPPSPTFFVKRTGSSIFKPRSNSSSLPHSLPRSDEDDENLQDPSLEAFPTQREQIFERVATIGSHLPEDEVVLSPYDAHSPALTVMSQACSSVDLAPIGSHTSLNRIAEEALLETEEDEDAALGSPILELPARPGAGASTEGLAPDDLVNGDELATPMPQDKRGEYFQENEDQQESAAAESVQKNDGAGDKFPAVHSGWRPNAIARPASALDPILTPPYTPEEHTVHAKTDGSRVAVAATSPERPVKAHPREKAATANDRPSFYVRVWRKLFNPNARWSAAAVGLAALLAAWWFAKG